MKDYNFTEKDQYILTIRTEQDKTDCRMTPPMSKEQTEKLLNFLYKFNSDMRSKGLSSFTEGVDYLV